MEAALMPTGPPNSCAILRRRTCRIGLWNSSSSSSSASQCDSDGVRIRFPSLSLPFRHGGCFVSAYSSSSSSSSSPKSYTRLYVSGLSFRTTEESLRNAFQNFGELVEVNLVMDRIANRPRGFAFLRYATEEESQKAIEGMHGKLALEEGKA
ncbi:hypothetical protein FNV43_RR21161 [Rhamnella rubrinervis]|uniref:RRM domain-containing protein n=1 Tax=Rhamnella rubrinervis TaxID=2594499 RepID=A0A8K0GU44_9ROSA|nr:hypothetical protein FNV43_RR21161 [Rhamnella rubrinervis]